MGQLDACMQLCRAPPLLKFDGLEQEPRFGHSHAQAQRLVPLSAEGAP